MLRHADGGHGITAAVSSAAGAGEAGVAVAAGVAVVAGVAVGEGQGLQGLPAQ